MTRPEKNTRMRSLYDSSSSRSAEAKTMAVPGLAPGQQLVPHPIGRLDVEAPGGMLHQQEPHVSGQHRQQHPLLVAARQRLGGGRLGFP